MLRSLFQAWLQNAARAQMRDAAVRAVQGELAGADASTADVSKPSEIGFVFALSIESGCLEDKLDGLISVRAASLVFREGGLCGRRAVIVLSGAGGKNAAVAAETLIDGHQPKWVVSAGFAGALTPSLQRNDILIADRVLCEEGDFVSVDIPDALAETAKQQGVRRGSLLTLDRVVRLPSERKALYKRHDALAVDMETFAVAETCRRRGIPFLAIRAINDTSDETLPRDVEHLLAQKSLAAQWGAALGSVWCRPASVKDLYRLRENALVASLRLADFLKTMVQNGLISFDGSS